MRRLGYLSSTGSSTTSKGSRRCRRSATVTPAPCARRSAARRPRSPATPSSRSGRCSTRCSRSASTATIRASSPASARRATSSACSPTPPPRASTCSPARGRGAPARRPSSWWWSTGCATSAGCRPSPRARWSAAARSGRSRRSPRPATRGWAGDPIPRRSCTCPTRRTPRTRAALDVLGFAPEQVRRLPSDAGFRLPAAALREAVRADLRGRPAAVLRRGHGRDDEHRGDRSAARSSRTCAPSTACGCTSTARTAPPRRSARPDGRCCAGLERADSLVLDPHKWLFQPYELGCVLVREPGLLERTFALDGAYLRDVTGGEVNFRDRSLAAHARRAGAQAVALACACSASPRSATRSHAASRSPSTRRRCSRRGPAGRSSRRPSSAIVCFRRWRRRPRADAHRRGDGQRRLRGAEHDRARRPRRRCACARSTRARRSSTSSARSSGWSRSTQHPGHAAIAAGPIPQQPPIPRAPCSRHPATTWRGSRRRPLRATRTRSPSQVRPLFG